MLTLRSLLVLVVLALPSVAFAAPLVIAGQARVIDGDTIAVDGRSIRLHGIDAPEMGQTCDRRTEAWKCGQSARAVLVRLIGRNRVVCDVTVAADAFDRPVAVCRAGGRDLGRAMVAEGAALAFVRYSDDYLADETAARAKGIGLWGSRFVTPSAHRNPVSDPTGDCQIKGNINAKGEHIYHQRGQQHFLKTQINKPGEAMFCSVAEAEAAGFRAARR